MWAGMFRNKERATIQNFDGILFFTFTWPNTWNEERSESTLTKTDREVRFQRSTTVSACLEVWRFSNNGISVHVLFPADLMENRIGIRVQSMIHWLYNDSQQGVTFENEDG